MNINKNEIKPLLTPSDALIELDKIRLGNIEKGFGIGSEKWDKHMVFRLSS